MATPDERQVLSSQAKLDELFLYYPAPRMGHPPGSNRPPCLQGASHRRQEACLCGVGTLFRPR